MRGHIFPLLGVYLSEVNVSISAGVGSHLVFLYIPIFATDPADVIVGMQQSSDTVTEGNVGSVCAELQALPVGGIEREILVTINAMDLSTG